MNALTDMPPVEVISKRVWLTVKVDHKVGGDSHPGKDYQARFWYHGGETTGWVDMDGNGVARFELWTFKSTTYVGIRSKSTPVIRSEHEVKFFQTACRMNELTDHLTVVFVFET